MAANGRFPPWNGLVIGLTAIVLTPEPIAPGDDAMLRQVLDVKAPADARRALRFVPHQPRPGGTRAWPSTPAPTASFRSRAAWPTCSASTCGDSFPDRDVDWSVRRLHGCSAGFHAETQRELRPKCCPAEARPSRVRIGSRVSLLCVSRSSASLVKRIFHCRTTLGGPA